MLHSPIRIGTRGSALARTQSARVRDFLSSHGIDAELVVISTPGDKSKLPIEQIGVGVFTSSLRSALLADEIDLAVHSYKDLPTAPVSGLTIGAVPEREDVRDALISLKGQVLGMLLPGSKIGTSAPRRISQITMLGLGLDIQPLRGNLDSRIRKVAEGELDAIVVARAGLLRLGLHNLVSEVFDPQQIMPAPAQGALAVEHRSDDERLKTILHKLDHTPSRQAVVAERSFLACLEAGCTAPIGATAEIVESLDDSGTVVDELFLRAIVCAPDGSNSIRGSITGQPDQAQQLGAQLAAEFVDRGAADLIPGGATTITGA